MERSTLYTLRAEIPERYKWDLTAMYSDEAAWEVDFARVPQLLQELAAYEGRLADSAETLVGALLAYERAGRLVDKVWQYAARHRDEDVSDVHYQALFDRANGLYSDLEAASAFIRPEMLELDPATLDSFMQQEPALQGDRHYVDNILREKLHLLSPREEALLAQAGIMSTSARTIHGMLIDADMPFGSVQDEQGNRVPISRMWYERLIRSGDRRVRRDAFNVFFADYMAHRNTLAATFAANVKKSVFFARARKHASALEASLFVDNIPVSVYTNLVDTVRANLPLLHRYLDLRKRALGLDELHLYDLTNSLVDEAGGDWPFDRAARTLLAALAPLGDDYVRALKAGLEARWVDVYETPNKRSNSHSAGCYDTYPYTMLVYLDTLQGAYTLAHEMGHAMHSYYSWKTQPYQYAYYSDFVSEVASILNEALLSHYLLEIAPDDRTRLLVVNMQLFVIRHSLFRQTMLAEFEKQAHEAAERNESLTAGWLCDTYYGLVKEYHGDGLVLDDAVRIEWAYLPHFYSNFYVYQYATGMAAATALSRQIIEQGAPAAERYRRFLSRGNSAYTIDLLRDAGVDMTTPEPILQALALFERRLDQLEELLH
jgi:oligoendopeptidase F